MAWTAPSTWVAGAILTAAQLNTQLRDNMLFLNATTNVVQTTVSGATGVANTTTFVDVSDGVTTLSATITPTFNTSKILVTAQMMVGGSASMMVGGRILRGATPIGLGAAAGSRTRVGGAVDIDGAAEMNPFILTLLDAPATTSATTYVVQLNAQTAGTAYINRTATDTDNAAFVRASSFLIVQEIPVP